MFKGGSSFGQWWNGNFSSPASSESNFFGPKSTGQKIQLRSSVSDFYFQPLAENKNTTFCSSSASFPKAKALGSRIKSDQFGNQVIEVWPEMKREDLEKILQQADQRIDVIAFVPHKWGHLNAFVYDMNERPWLRDAGEKSLQWVWNRRGKVPPMWTALLSAYIVPTTMVRGERKFLAVYDPPPSHEAGRFFVPEEQLHFLLGGTVEKGELALAGAIREAREEAGINLEPSDLRFFKVQQVPYGPRYPDRVIYYYLLEGKKAEIDWNRQIWEKGDGELGGALWVTLESNNFEDHTRRALTSI